jgi:hypothetical protein
VGSAAASRSSGEPGNGTIGLFGSLIPIPP